MKKNRVTPAKYRPSYNSNYQEKLDKVREAQNRREFGIKANWKKTQRKNNSGQRDRGGVESAVAEVVATSKWSVAPSTPTESPGGNSARPGPKKNFIGTDKWKGQKPSAMTKAKTEFRKKKDEKSERMTAAKRRQEERALAITNRKKKRLEKYKILNQKTPKGQPLMKGRINMLLDKIQKSL